MISAASLAIVTASFSEGPERNRALGLWGAMGGVGGAPGALLGGVLTQGFGWPRDLPHQRPDRRSPCVLAGRAA